MRRLVVLAVVFCALGTVARAAPGCGLGVTDDTLRPLPAALAPVVARAFGLTMPPARVARSTVTRCLSGRVLACFTGANLPCGKANLSRGLPLAGRDWCRRNRNIGFIPAYITGHDSVWRWRCAHGTPRAGGPAAQVDARGFLTKYWRVVG